MKSYNWKKGIWIIVISGFIGAVVGLLMSMIEESNYLDTVVSVATSIAPSFYVIGFISGMIGLGGYFYFNGKLKKEHYCDEEGSFYDTHEKAMSIVMMCSTLCAVINFTALGINIFNSTPFAILFFVNVILAFWGEVAHVALVKKVRPELDADPLEINFNRDYFDKLDEFEKDKLGKACFKTISVMTPIYVFLFLLCYGISLIFNVSAVICLPIGIIWAVQTILMTYYNNKDYSKTK